MATWADVQKYMPTSPPNPDMGDYTHTAVIPGIGNLSFVWQDNAWKPKITGGGNGQETWLSPGPNGEVQGIPQASGDSSFLGAIKALLPAAAVAAPAIAGGLGLFGGAGSAGGGLITPESASSLAANAGGASLAPGATTLNGALEAAVENAGNMSLIPGSLAPAANIPSFLPAAGGALAGGVAGSLTSSPSAGGMMGVDQPGSDWATGQANMANPGGMLPVDPSTGLTLANTAAGSGVAGAVNGIPQGEGFDNGSPISPAVGKLLNGAGVGAGGLLSSIGSVAGSLAPGLAALAYANSQPGFDPSKINDVLGGFSGINTSGSQDVLNSMKNTNVAGSLQGVLSNMQNANTSGALQGVLGTMQNANPSAPLQGVLGNIQGANPNANSQGAMSALQSADPTAALRATLAQAQGNAPGYVQASINPLLASQAAGYGDMLQSQAKRGIYGSSFGNNDIGNFLNTTGRGISDAGINAEQSALGLQANIGSNIGSLTNTNLGQRANLAGQMDQNAYNNLGLQANAAGNIGNLQNTALANQANAAGNIGSLQNSALASQANAAGNIGSLQNQNFATQGTIANQIPNTQINSLSTQGNLAAQLAALNVAQQNSKNNMYGRALGLFGNSLSGNSGLSGGLSQIGSGLSSSLGSLLSSLGITG